MCPFCYIGKRKFEGALEQFPNRDKVQIIWKSYQLAPDLQTDPATNIDQYLADHKGMSLEQAKGMNRQVTQMAAQVGLEYNFDKAVVANSFNAHRFSHFAAQHGKQDEAEELLFKAYFTEGKNIDDQPTLLQLGASLGLDTQALQTALEDGSYAREVLTDIQEASMIGVRGVPFFVLDRKYAVSGAQETGTFAGALEKAYAEWEKTHPSLNLEVVEGPVCTPDGTCD